VIPLTQASTERIAQVYSRRGKGLHPAGLNLGDCFAYDVAREPGCALLYVGDDFAKTDIGRAT
jgi:ribonuclease VapC